MPPNVFTIYCSTDSGVFFVYLFKGTFRYKVTSLRRLQYYISQVKTQPMQLSDFIQFRHTIHTNPELSGEEYNTKQRVLTFLKKFDPSEIIEVGKTGLLFSFAGNKKGKTIMIRAELDALPIQEINEFKYASVSNNVSHKCGHDGHMTLLARLAYLLSINKPTRGTVYLLFQPAEENGMGAKEVYNDPKFKQIKIDQVVALHNIPGYPLKSIIIKEGAFTPAVRSIIVKYKGKTSHAAEPEKGINPAIAMADFLKTALALSTPQTLEKNFFLVSPIYTTMGALSYGVTAGYGEVHLTIRAWQNELLDSKAKELETIAKDLGASNNLQTTIEWTQAFQANINNKATTDNIQKAAKALHLPVINIPTPMKWGEDFGLFTQHFEGAMFGLGAGESHAALHNPDYDFPDALIETGSNIFEQIIRQYLDE